MDMELSRLLPGSRGRVTAVRCREVLRCRLRSFGLIPGTEIYVRYRSPGGGVTALELRGTVVALRTRELRGIRVCPL